MKTLKFFLGLSIILLMSFISCSKRSNQEETKLKVSDFKKLGKIHNDFLTNAKENFTILDNIKNEQDKVNYINQFNKNFVSSLNMNMYEKNLFITELENNKNLVKQSYLTSSVFGYNTLSRTDNNEQNIFEIIDSLHQQGIICNQSFQLLNSLANDLKDNYKGNLSDNELKINIENLITEFNNIGFPTNSEGEMVGTVLAISIASIEWWEENPDAFGSETRLAHWAAADIAGAAWGAVTGAIGSYAGSGEVNWASVGIGAVSGAIAGSTGAIGRIAAWLRGRLL